ncbi:MAG: TIGR03905 family TSCPD domain-containing protein [Eubacteriales bacterium]|nr:TIGR03905 family TSCPD domain-containing protein [Eubacteriales bacterium]
MKYTYSPKGVCSSKIEFELTNGKIRNLVFTAGCNGNLKAIAKLVEGMDAERVASLLEGNVCGYKNTSCADQLARAIRQAQARS